MIVDNDYAKKKLITFFKFPGVKKVVAENNFDELFSAWDKFRKADNSALTLRPHTLARFLEECGIDWINYSTSIPDLTFWYYEEPTLFIPKNIKKIGKLPFRFSNLKEIHYEGTSDDFNKIQKPWDTHATFMNDDKEIKVICSDGPWKRRFEL